MNVFSSAILKFSLAFVLALVPIIAFAEDVAWHCYVVDTPGGVYNINNGGTVYILVTTAPWGDNLGPVEDQFHEWVRSHYQATYQFHDGMCFNNNGDKVYSEDELFDDLNRDWSSPNGKVVRVTRKEKSFGTAE